MGSFNLELLDCNNKLKQPGYGLGSSNLIFDRDFTLLFAPRVPCKDFEKFIIRGSMIGNC